MITHIENSWKKVLVEELSSEYFKDLCSAIQDSYKTTTTFPPQGLIFNAFEHCHFDTVKVVIIGQDPYHRAGQAHGLSFSVPDAVPVPPSLRNIYMEVSNDVQSKTPESGNLERWANQGVLLLNSTLTVAEAKPGSHQNLGWERFTNTVIKKISSEHTHVVFMLWGNYAQSKIPCIDSSKHLILTAPHPSPLSAYRGFFGCAHFSAANAYLSAHGRPTITW